MRIAVIGHVEHITITRVPALPAAGEILHIDDPVVFAGGGGGVAFYQLTKSDAELHLFTAIGIDDAALHVYSELATTTATIHAAIRMEPHTRDIVLVTPDGERTIIVVGQPLHPAIDDRLSWDILATCDAVYFTGEDAETLKMARKAQLLVVTARRAHVLEAAGVRADVVVGSVRDPRENRPRGAYTSPPGALVLTDGGNGGTVATATSTTTFRAPKLERPKVGEYGAGDTFAAALTWYLATGAPVVEACERAAHHGAAVLLGLNPIEHQKRLS
jgi:ribokinase